MAASTWKLPLTPQGDGNSPDVPRSQHQYLLAGNYLLPRKGMETLTLKSAIAKFQFPMLSFTAEYRKNLRQISVESQAENKNCYTKSLSKKETARISYLGNRI
jgi:hypothetical protein